MNKQLWMDAAKKAGLEQFEIYEQRHTSTSINVYEQKVDSFSISDCDGTVSYTHLIGYMMCLIGNRITDSAT